MRFGEFNFRLRVRRLLVGEIKILQIARFVKMQRGFGGTFRCFRHCLAKIDKLLVALMLVKGRAHFGRDIQDFMTHAQLCRFELRGGDAFAQRQQHKVDELFENIHFQRLTRKSSLESENRIPEQTCFDEIRLRNSEFLVGCLQVVIVEQRDLHRRVGGQRSAQERSNRCLRFRIFRAAAIPLHALACSQVNCVRELLKRRVWIDMCAAGDPRKQEKFWQHHCPASFLINVIPQIGHLPGLSDLIWGCMGQV